MMHSYVQGGNKMRILALINRIIQEIFRDKRTLALLFIAPILILSLMHFLFNGETENPSLGVIGIDSDLISSFEDAEITIKTFEEVADPSELVIENELDGLLQMDMNEYKLTLENNDPTSAKALEMKINQMLMAHMQANLIGQTAKVTPNEGKPDFQKESLEITYVYGSSETVFFDVLGPILVGYFV